MEQRTVRMKQGEIDLFQLTLLGVAAVGGMMAGTCGALRRILSNGEARTALVLGYVVLGLSGGVVGVAMGIFLPPLDVNTLRGALVVGAASGALVTVALLGANIGSVLTFRWKGMRVTIEPDDPKHDRRHYDRRKEDCGHDKTRD